MSLLARLLIQPKPPHNLIAPNPNLGLQFMLRGIFLLIVVMFLAFFIFELILFRTFLFSWLLLLPPLVFFFNTVLSSVLIYYWKRIEHWRFAAAQGNHRLLADEQPWPNPGALQVPARIVTSQVIEYRLAIGYTVFIGVYFAIFAYFALLDILSPIWLSVIVVLVGGLFIFLFILIYRMKHIIEITQEGIRSGTGSTPFLIFWHEMRLFACYPEPDPWKNSPALIYELSSASYVVRWTRLRRKSPFSVMRGRFLPFEEHNAQMQALCELIAAKTGLPLYDLSKGRTLILENPTRHQ